MRSPPLPLVAAAASLIALGLAGAAALWRERGAAPEATGSRSPTPSADRPTGTAATTSASVIAHYGSSRLRHAASVTGLAFTPDGATLLSTSHDGTLRAHAATDGATRWVSAVHDEHIAYEGAVVALALSPDGKVALTGGRDGRLTLTDVVSGAVARSWPAHDQPIIAVAFAPSAAQQAASLDDRGTVHLWSLVSDGSERERTLVVDELAQAHVWGGALAYAPDGKHLATALRQTALWDVAAGKPVWTKPVQASALAFLDDATLVGAGSGRMHVWRASDGAARDDVDGSWRGIMGSGAGYGIAVASGGRFASSGSDGNVALFALDRDAAVFNARGHTRFVKALAFSPDGTRLASAGGDCAILIRDAADGRVVVGPEGYTSWVQALALSPDGARVATGGNDGVVHLWDATSGALGRFYAGHTNTITDLAFFPDGARLASSSYHDHVVRIWGDGGLHLEGHQAPVLGVAVASDGERVATASYDDTVRIWSARDGKQLHVVRGNKSQGGFTSVAFSPDGTLLAAGPYAAGGAVILVDAKTGRIVRKLDAAAAYGLRFIDDGATLVAMAGGQARAFDVETGRRRFDMHVAATRIAIAPRGHTLAALQQEPVGDADSLQVVLYEVATGLERRRLTTSDVGDFLALEYAPASRSARGTVTEALVLGGKGGALAWNYADAHGDRLRPPSSRDDVERAWRDLAGDDAVLAYDTILALVDAPAAARKLATRAEDSELRQGFMSHERLRALRLVETLELIEALAPEPLPEPDPLLRRLRARLASTFWAPQPGAHNQSARR